MREGESVAANVLNSLGVELSKVRTAVEFIIGPGDAANMPSSPSEITLSPRTKKVIELAIDEARKLNHRHVGPEHLLLGLVREGQGSASGVIESLGVTLAKVRQQVLATIGKDAPEPATNVYSNVLVQSGPFDLLRRRHRVLPTRGGSAAERHNGSGRDMMIRSSLEASRSAHGRLRAHPRTGSSGRQGRPAQGATSRRSRQPSVKRHRKGDTWRARRPTLSRSTAAGPVRIQRHRIASAAHSARQRRRAETR